MEINYSQFFEFKYLDKEGKEKNKKEDNLQFAKNFAEKLKKEGQDIISIEYYIDDVRRKVSEVQSKGLNKKFGKKNILPKELNAISEKWLKNVRKAAENEIDKYLNS